MKVISAYEGGRPIFSEIIWGDHWPACEKCRNVNLEKPATLANCCAQGAALINEELIKRQIPVVAQKKAEVRRWAEAAGCFKID